MLTKRQERRVNISAILLVLLIMFACVGGLIQFRHNVRAENVCGELVNNLDYHVINGRVYCVDHETVELIDSGLTLKY